MKRCPHCRTKLSERIASGRLRRSDAVYCDDRCRLQYLHRPKPRKAPPLDFSTLPLTLLTDTEPRLWKNN